MTIRPRDERSGMRRHAAALAALLIAWLLPGPSGLAPDPAPSQEGPALALDASPELIRQMEEAPAELAWSELPRRLTVRFTAGEIIERMPIQIDALAVRDGEIVERSSTDPAVADAGQPIPASEVAGSGWPPAGGWFPAEEWRPGGLVSGSDDVVPEPGRVASALAPTEGAAVVLFAAPAADELRKRFRTRPVAITVRRREPPARPDTVSPDTVGS